MNYSLEALSTCIRPMIQASPGNKLAICDLSAIENRALMWMSGCEPGLAVYAKGLDPYIDFAARLYKVPYSEITKIQRQICKPAVLGCGYGLGPGQEKVTKTGQIELTGLRAYAENMGVRLTPGEASDMVNTFRKDFKDVVHFWKHLERAFLMAYRNGTRQRVGFLYFGMVGDCLYIDLPSGRRIHYMNPEAWRDDRGISIRFDGLRNGFWGNIVAWGGVICENVVQAVSRDVLVEGMFRAEGYDIPIVGHSHDELICEVDAKRRGVVPMLETLMSQDIEWAPGLPLGAEGMEMDRYAKG